MKLTKVSLCGSRKSKGQRIAEIHPPSPAESGPEWLGSFASRGQIIGDLVKPIAIEDWEAPK